MQGMSAECHWAFSFCFKLLLSAVASDFIEDGHVACMSHAPKTFGRWTDEKLNSFEMVGRIVENIKLQPNRGNDPYFRCFWVTVPVRKNGMDLYLPARSSLIVSPQALVVDLSYKTKPKRKITTTSSKAFVQ